MVITYTKQDLKKAIDSYRAKYGERVSWEVILNNIKVFKDNQEAILNTPNACLSWHGFLHYLAEIESTIGLYSYTSKGTFYRIFVMFGRAYLEEKETIESNKGKELQLEWIFESSKYFKKGDGKKGDIDLHDLNGLTYDVKNDYVNFEKAHDADFLLKYRSLDGIVELHTTPTNPAQGSFIKVFEQCRPVAELVISYGLDPLLFNKESSEEDIEKYLGLID